nr:hypothetical protein [Tanacetum cinerariifolium]
MAPLPEEELLQCMLYFSLFSQKISQVLFHSKEGRSIMNLELLDNQGNTQPRFQFVTTSKHLAEITRKVDKNITKRGLVRKTSTNKANNYCVDPVTLVSLFSPSLDREHSTEVPVCCKLL